MASKMMVQGGDNIVNITIVAARNLPASDVNGKSDPYCVLKDTTGIHISGDGIKTPVVKKNLNPVWNCTFPPLHFNYKLAHLKFLVYDHDTFSKDDLLAKVKIPAEWILDGQTKTQWFPMKVKLEGIMALGVSAVPELQITVSTKISIPLVFPGKFIQTDAPQLALGLGWDTSKKRQIDLDASVVALDASGNIVDKIWFRNLTGLAGAVRHRGDNRTGAGEGDDETIDFNMAAIPPNVVALVVLIDSFTKVPMTKVKSAYVRVFIPATMQTIAFSRLSNFTDACGLFFGCFYRDAASGRFYFRTAAMPCEAGPAAVPQLMSYLKSAGIV